MKKNRTVVLEAARGTLSKSACSRKCSQSDPVFLFVDCALCLCPSGLFIALCEYFRILTQYSGDCAGEEIVCTEGSSRFSGLIWRFRCSALIQAVLAFVYFLQEVILGLIVYLLLFITVLANLSQSILHFLAVLIPASQPKSLSQVLAKFYLNLLAS